MKLHRSTDKFPGSQYWSFGSAEWPTVSVTLLATQLVYEADLPMSVDAVNYSPKLLTFITISEYIIIDFFPFEV